MHLDRKAPGSEIAHREGPRRAPGGVVVEVFRQTLQREVRNTGDDVEVVPVRVAVEDGDDYVVNGSKIWTSFGHYADWCYLAVRTDPTAPKRRRLCAA